MFEKSSSVAILQLVTFCIAAALGSCVNARDGDTPGSASSDNSCGTFNTPWIQVNGVGTEEAQYIDAGESIQTNSPTVGFPGRTSFGSVVNNAGDLV